MSKSNSEGSLFGFIMSGSVAPKVAIIMVLGILLLILGRGDIVATKGESAEEKIAELCSMTEGVGECHVTVTYSAGGEEVYAVAVLCDGSDSPKVRETITSVICSLYGIGAHRVTVMKLGE